MGGENTVNAATNWSFSATGSDPGVNDVLTYNWDMDDDGEYDDFTGAAGEWMFPDGEEGLKPIGLQLTDGDGGVDTQVFELVVTVPEPTSMALLAMGGLAMLKRKRRA